MSGWSVHLTTLFSWASLTWAVNKYVVYILLLVTDNNPSWISRREENGHRNYFMINLHESMGPGRDQTRDPWICSQTGIFSQTHYWLRYAAQSSKKDIMHNVFAWSRKCILLGAKQWRCMVSVYLKWFCLSISATCGPFLTSVPYTCWSTYRYPSNWFLEYMAEYIEDLTWVFMFYWIY